MNKTDFIAVIANKTALTKTDAAKYLDAVIETLTDIFQRKETLTLPGFGTFGVKERAERSGRNPSTGKAIIIPAAQVPFMRVSPRIKALTNNEVSKNRQKSSKKQNL